MDRQRHGSRRLHFQLPPAKSTDTICPNCGYESSQDGVIFSCLDCFLSNGKLYCFQYSESLFVFLHSLRGGTSTCAHSDPPEDELHRAKYLLRHGFGMYHVVNNNCEDFTIYCKTGLVVIPGSLSSSSSSAFTNTGVGRSGQGASLGAVFGSESPDIATYFQSRYLSDIGVRTDVMKIPVEELTTRDPEAKHQREPESVSEMAKED